MKKDYAIVKVLVGSMEDWYNDKCRTIKVVVDNTQVTKLRATSVITETNNCKTFYTSLEPRPIYAQLGYRGPQRIERDWDVASFAAHLYGRNYLNARRKNRFMQVNGELVADYRSTNLTSPRLRKEKQ